MPYVPPSWRTERPGLRWLSLALCVLGRHHWIMSSTLKAPVACAVCSRKTRHWEEYKRLSGEARRRSLQ